MIVRKPEHRLLPPDVERLLDRLELAEHEWQMSGKSIRVAKIAPPLFWLWVRALGAMVNYVPNDGESGFGSVTFHGRHGDFEVVSCPDLQSGEVVLE